MTNRRVPTITSLTPNHGLTGSTVIVAGSNLGSSGVVRFGSTSASTSNWTATSVTCTVPASLSPGAVNVTVTPSGGGASNALSFTVDSTTLKHIELDHQRAADDRPVERRHSR